jgi:hypothetical protein
MAIYPVPIEVTQARVQLVADQTAKAPGAQSTMTYSMSSRPRTRQTDTGCHRPQGLSSFQNPHQPLPRRSHPDSHEVFRLEAG